MRRSGALLGRPRALAGHLVGFLGRLDGLPDRLSADGVIARVPLRVRRPFGRRPDWRTPVGLAVAAVIGLVLYSTTGFDAGRPDIFYLSDAFLHGSAMLPRPMGSWDVIPWPGGYYLPFGPFPSILFMPLMLFISPEQATQWEPVVNSCLAALDVALLWWLAARVGVERIRDRVWLVVLLALGTDMWWVVVRGGVWHTGHLVATMLTLMALIECFGRRRPLLVGLPAGAAFLSRSPVIFGLLFYAWVMTRDRDVRTGAGRRSIARDWLVLGLGVAPSIAFYFCYNQVRFGSPLESGYELALLPAWLAALRDQGLFSLSHLGRNWDYFVLRLPQGIDTFPFFKPDSHGNSILFTSPALLLALRAGWRRAMPWALGLAFVAIMLPNLLYYGGGWFQFGFRYALDAIPFALVLCALALRRRSASLMWWAVLAFCVFVNAGGAWWAYRAF
jgi:hypothetical protein